MQEICEFNVEPTGKSIGADIEGVDLSRDLDPATCEKIGQAWWQHLVLRFRGQRLTDSDLERFSARFGKLDRMPVLSSKTIDTTGSPYVTVISNVVVDGKPIGDLGDAEALWHTDMSYNDVPPMGSALYALEVPPAGGETGFCNMYLAFEMLPAAMRKRVSALQCKHDSSRNSTGMLRVGYSDAQDPRECPGAVHPLVRTHPVTGRSALFLGRRRNASIVGLPLAESETLLDELWAHATRPEFTWHQEWRVGDLVMWDNRCVMHRRNAFDPSSRRVMHRTQISGDKPFHRAAA
jgi:taurine dioxygenase